MRQTQMQQARASLCVVDLQRVLQEKYLDIVRSWPNPRANASALRT